VRVGRKWFENARYLKLMFIVIQYDSFIHRVLVAKVFLSHGRGHHHTIGFFQRATRIAFFKRNGKEIKEILISKKRILLIKKFLFIA